MFKKAAVRCSQWGDKIRATIANSNPVDIISIVVTIVSILVTIVPMFMKILPDIAEYEGIKNYTDSITNYIDKYHMIVILTLLGLLLISIIRTRV